MDAAQARAGIYALLSNGLRYPDDALVGFLCEQYRSDRWPAPMEGFPAELNVRIDNLHKTCHGFRGRSGPQVLEELRVHYGRLFGHSVRGTCPLYELEYGRSEIIQQTAELADLAGFYNAFGMNLHDSAFERADHVAVECEFLSVLCAKEAWGRQQNISPLAETCSDAQRLFLRDHLARWLPAFAQRVMSAEPDGLYGRLAALASAFITHECRTFDLEIGPPWLELRPDDPAADASIECDAAGCGPATADQLVQIGLESQTDAGSQH